MTVLDTIYWINQAWWDVSTDCIMRCFDSLRETAYEPDSDIEEDDDIPLAQLAQAQTIYGCDING